MLGLLRRLGKSAAATTYQRQGVRDVTFGVSYADIGALAKKLGVNTSLAQQLWATCVHDARMVATKVADPAAVAQHELEAWLAQANNSIITEAIAALAARMPNARALAQAWIMQQGEWISTAGWSIVVSLASAGHLEKEAAQDLLIRIEQHIHSAANRTRLAMNAALIAIGGSIPELTERAILTARSMGDLQVDHGAAGGKTPDAETMIERWREKASGKTPGAPR